jgi:hypothetical protein
MADQNVSDYEAKRKVFEPSRLAAHYAAVDAEPPAFHRAPPMLDLPRDSFSAPADAHPSSRKFYAVLADAARLHDKKQRDYGTDADPFANVRASEDFGIPAWLGCMIRGNDKVVRVKSFATKGVLANESIEDALIDLLVYAGIALVLYREGQ